MRTAKHAVTALAFLIGFAQLAMAQSSRIAGGAVSRDKFGFYWETRLEPSTPPLADSFSTETSFGPGDVIHRLMLDRAQRVYVGYDVLVEPLAEANTYRVTFQQLTMTRELTSRYLSDAPTGWTLMPTPGWSKGRDQGLPAPQNIRGGDVVALNLLTNATTGQKVVDYVTVQEPAHKFTGFDSPVPDRKFAFATGQPRDFKANDVELSILAPRLSINGKLDESSARRFDEESGAVVWFYAANRGRFILSLVPHPELGFRQAGEVRGSSLSFKIGNDTFTLSTGGRIAPGQAPFNLYVLHQPEWRASYPNADLTVFIMGSADRAESLVKK